MYALSRKNGGAPKKIAVGMDLEGVIVKSPERVIEIFNAISGAPPVPYSMLKTYDMTKYLRYGNGKSISNNYLLELFAEAWRDQNRIQLVDSRIPKIFGNLNHLKIQITTATSGGIMNVTKLLRDNEISPYSTSFFKTEEDKLKFIISKDNLVAYVDDNPMIALKAAQAGKRTFCLDLYFRDISKHKNLTRVANWTELQERLMAL